jgi:pantoate--beta-alanine ligase
MPLPGQVQVLTTVAELRAALAPLRRAGMRIGLVPTMGALHEGHLSLVRASKAECDVTVATIFVNPAQFGPNKDLSKYPRTFDTDLEKLAGCETDFLFAPANEDVYRADHATLCQTASFLRASRESKQRNSSGYSGSDCRVAPPRCIGTFLFAHKILI